VRFSFRCSGAGSRSTLPLVCNYPAETRFPERFAALQSGQNFDGAPLSVVASVTDFAPVNYARFAIRPVLPAGRSACFLTFSPPVFPPPALGVLFFGPYGQRARRLGSYKTAVDVLIPGARGHRLASLFVFFPSLDHLACRTPAPLFARVANRSYLQSGPPQRHGLGGGGDLAEAAGRIFFSL